MVEKETNGKKAEIRPSRDEPAGEEPRKGELRVFAFGLVYSVVIVIVLILMFSFLFLAETEPEGIDEPDDLENQIYNYNYPDFFNNDISHYPNGSESVTVDRCYLCHDDTGTDILFTFDTFKIFNSTKEEVATKCFQCHLEPKHKVQTPYNICTDCHYTDDHNALSLTFNFILAKEGEINNNFCIECHEPQCSELKEVGHIHEDTCTACHNDHKRIPGCLDCHDPSYVGPYHDLSSLEFEVCTNCHSGGAHTRPVINDEMDCSICHSDWYMINLEKFGGKHFTNPNLGKCSSCHTEHKKYPTCTDCHGKFPPHQVNITEPDPNQDCTVCHEGGAHDNRVNYQNYVPEFGDTICEVCHETEYRVYYDESTEGEKEVYGNCLNCHEEHNTLIKIPHMTPPEFLECSKCHEGYDGAHTMHVIQNTSFIDFPYSLVPDEFCSNCHSSEYEIITSNIDSGFKNFYGGCTDCHNDHKLIVYSHQITSPFNNCNDCHLNYADAISIHDQRNITYENFTSIIGNDFCSSCHNIQSESLSNNIHSIRSCLDCHGEHETTAVDFGLCESCHDVPTDHDIDRTGCSDCHSTEPIHSSGLK
jgi:hypothetical protein